MPGSIKAEVLNHISYLVGSAELVQNLVHVPARVPFDDVVAEFLNDLSRSLMKNREAKEYSDLVTFAFWIRRGSIKKMQERFAGEEGVLRLGKGVVFHIAPSNVPVNFAYSLVSGLLCGNANIVRVPSREFPQVRILADAITHALARHPQLRQYILLVRYGHEKEVNDLFSSIADMRMIWGGDQTIAEIRRSPLPPRSGEITFADRYSMAVIDSDAYLAIEDKARVAEDFYNDTYFTDQNACTSPRLIVWMGRHVEEAKRIFWAEAHALVKKKYPFQPIQGVNKLTKCCLFAAENPHVRLEPREDNLVIRLSVDAIGTHLIDYQDNSGLFFEYDCRDILELLPLCRDKRCQTIAYLGDNNVFLPLLKSGIRGIDRIVPIGKTMDFDLIWDGCNLPAMLTRAVQMIG